MTNIIAGTSYSVKVSALNGAGESDQSPSLSIIAAVSADAPSAPTLVDSAQTFIKIGWQTPASDGGSAITNYEIYGKLATDSDTAWALLQSVDTSSLTYTQSSIPTAGVWYQYKVRAKSAFGYSSFSSVSSFISAKAPTMSTPTLVSATKTTLTVSWLVQDNGGSSVTGYILSQADIADGVYAIVYSGQNIPLVTSYTSTVISGHSYKYKVIGINSAGQGQYSTESGGFLAATAPKAPQTLIYVSSTSTTLQVKFGDRNSDDGGSPVTRSRLYMAAVGTTTLSEVTQYNGQDSTYTLDKAVITSLVTGTIYQFASTVQNAAGESPKSDIAKFGLGSLPSQMAAPSVNYAISTGDTLSISWIAGTSPDLPIVGYQLSNQNGVVYDGKLNSNILSTIVTGLTKGTRYYFYVIAYNANGAGPKSADLIAYACIAPSNLDPPKLSSSTSTSLNLVWTAPGIDGGCPLIQYRLYRDDGLGGTVTTEVSPASFTSNPSLTQFNVASLTGTGNTFRFKLRAENIVGYIESSTVGFVLAGVPSKPSTLTFISAGSTYQKIQLQFPTLLAANNGGSAYTGIDLQRALSSSSTYSSILTLTTGLITSYTDTSSSLVKGNAYKYHYRVSNVNGWSDYSDDLTVTAASVPGKPTTPTVSALTATQITLLLPSPSDVGGSPITQIDLEMGTGITNPTFSVIKTGLPDITYTVSTSDGLTTGQSYSFRSRAKNSIGYGDYSTILIAGCGTKPSSSPSGLATDANKNSANIVYLSWSAITPGVGELPILGYIIEQKLSSGSDATYVTAYDGSSNPSQLFASITGLSSGVSYSFRAYGVNVNGRSNPSTVVTVLACGKPDSPSTPTFKSTSQAGITINWNIPSNTGGCPLTGFDVLIYRTATSTFEKVNTNSDANPILQEFLCDSTCLPSGAALGTQYIFKVRAKNSAPLTSADSNPSNAMIFADVPNTPTTAPVNDQTGTTTSQIKIIYGTVTTINGSPITSYEVQMASQLSPSSFTTMQNTLSLSALIASGISSGQTYLFQYRAINSVGAGGWSPSGSILAASVPTKMASPVVTVVGTNIRISWSAATINGSPLTKYTLQILQKATSVFQNSPCDGSTAAVIANLYCEIAPSILKTTYGYSDYDIPSARISATNNIGDSPYSDASTSGSMIPTVPGKPTTPPTKNAGGTYDTQIQITINALTTTTSTGGASITSYNIQWDQGTSTWVDLSNSLLLSATVTGLTLGSTYSFKYRGVNSMGSGTFSDILSIKAVSLPGQIATPTKASSGVNNLKVQLSWTAPTNGGGTISLYRVIMKSSSGSDVVTNSYCDEGNYPTTTCTISMSSFWSSPFSFSVAGTAITMQVQAYNEAGWGTLSATATGTPVIETKPLIPTILPWSDTGTTFSQLQVSWTALGTGLNGGSSITRYSLKWDAGASTTPSVEIYSGLATTTTITVGITAGVTYNFIYAGENKYGLGGYSAMVSLRVPATNPSAPAAPTTAISGNSVQICWTAPTSTGGSNIINYNVFVRDKADATYKQNPTQCVNPDINTRCCSIDTLVVMSYYHLITGDEVKAKVSAINNDNLESAQSAETVSGAIV